MHGSRHVRNTPFTAAALLAVYTLAAPAAAQAPERDGDWQPWYGCWAPVAGDEAEADTPLDDTLICVRPLADGAVEIATLVGGEVAERERLDARAGRRPSEHDGCVGWESLTWSADGRRVYRTAEHECAGGLRRQASDLFAILPGGDWLTAQTVTAGGQTGVRVLRHRPVAQPAWDAATAAALRGQAMAAAAARLAAAAPIAIADVIDAARHADVAVVEAWLIEHGQGFALDAAKLVALSEAGVPDRVIDLMVALSYPGVFAIDRGTRIAAQRPDEGVRRDPRRPRRGTIGWDPWLYPGYGYGGRYGWYGGRAPIIVIGSPAGQPRSRGRLVKGRGYTQGNDEAGAQPRSRSPSAGNSSGGDSSGGTARPSSGGSGSTRTAKPRSRDG